MLNICILSNNVIKQFMNHKLTKPILSAIGLSERPSEMSAFFPWACLYSLIALTMKICHVSVEFCPTVMDASSTVGPSRPVVRSRAIFHKEYQLYSSSFCNLLTYFSLSLFIFIFLSSKCSVQHIILKHIRIYFITPLR